MEQNILEELYGVLLNYINSQKDFADWEMLTEYQKSEIYDAIHEIEVGEGIPNNVVLEKLHAKY